jgi:uncharacterized protein YyaL (SSP411 family)
MLLCSLDYALGPAYEITLLGSLQDTVIVEMLQAIRSRYLPNKSIVLACEEEIREITPFAKNLVKVDGKTTAYVCTDHVCSLPTTSPEEMMKLFA